MLVPGSVHIYIRKVWRKFILTFLGTELVLAIAVWLGTSLQSPRAFNLPQGLCPGILALIILVPLFLNGQKAITEYNQLLDNEVLYQSQKPVSQDDNDEKMKNLQKMRDEGLISEQQYNNRKSQVASKK